jgi:hypothetical protein
MDNVLSGIRVIVMATPPFLFFSNWLNGTLLHTNIPSLFGIARPGIAGLPAFANKLKSWAFLSFLCPATVVLFGNLKTPSNRQHRGSGKTGSRLAQLVRDKIRENRAKSASKKKGKADQTVFGPNLSHFDHKKFHR